MESIELFEEESDFADDADRAAIFQIFNMHYNNNSDTPFLDLLANYKSSQSVTPQEIAIICLSALGLLLNSVLIGALLLLGYRRRPSLMLKNQRIYIGLLACAHNLLCLVNLIEFGFVAVNLFGAWSACLDIFRRRTVTSFCNMLIFCSVLGCAADNYLAICHPLYHRLKAQANRCHQTVFALGLCGAFLLSVVVGISDVLLPSSLFDSSCISLAATSISDQELHMPLIFWQHITKQRLLDFCQMVDQCQPAWHIQEMSVLLFWLLCAAGMSFFYLRTVTVIHASRPSSTLNLHNPSVASDNNSGLENRLRLSARRSTSTSAREQQKSPYMVRRNTEQQLPIQTSNSNKVKRLSSSKSITPLASLKNHPVRQRYNSIVTSLTPASRTTSRDQYQSGNNFAVKLQQRRLSTNRRRSVRTLIIIFLLFVLTWLPAVLFRIANAFFFTESFRVEYLPNMLPVITIVEVLLLLNTIIDPLVYGFRHSELKSQVCRVRRPDISEQSSQHVRPSRT